MSFETRSNSALCKRADQLRRWEESETNREPVSPKNKSRKIKFSSGCVFLAACAAGDKDEVLDLLEKGADINTANVDGLTALHQACIDDNLDMVEFLVKHGADVNRGDNEGWTPLHATASCSFLYIAKYLIESGANVAAVNNDGELAVDIADSKSMETLLNAEIASRGINCEEARNEEHRIMLRDANEWLSSKSPLANAAHPKTRATALHTAAAKGYTDVMKIILQCGVDVDPQDVDGWTPLHAAAHWGQKEACQILVENLAEMDAKNCVGQTPFDLSDTDIFRYLEDLKQKQNNEEVLRRRKVKACHIPVDIPSKVKKVEEEKDTKIDDKIEKKNRVNASDPVSISNKTTEPVRLPPTVPPKQLVDSSENNLAFWRKQNARQTKAELPSPEKTTTGSINNRLSYTDVHSEKETDPKRPTSLQNDKDETNDENSSSTTTPPAKTPSPASSPQANSQPLRISFVPPVRDEESETQRKANAKRARETRRSTQGVTLEEIKSAEEFIKKSNNQSTNNNNEQFKLEDVKKTPEPPSTPSYIRRTANTTRPASAPIETADTTVTLSLRRPKTQDDKEQDKENDVRNAQATLATQAAIQRRRRPKRRSTGVVSFENMDDLDPEKDSSGGGGDYEDSKVNHEESGNDRSSRSRLSSTSDIRNENGEIDYKKLYEQAIVENSELKDKLKKSDQESRDAKQTLEKLKLVTSKNSLSELEKRERRAMERKLSEMEEELKQLQKLKAENERLKADNRSLTRVITKLTNSPIK